MNQRESRRYPACHRRHVGERILREQARTHPDTNGAGAEPGCQVATIPRHTTGRHHPSPRPWSADGFDERRAEDRAGKYLYERRPKGLSSGKPEPRSDREIENRQQTNEFR